MSEPARRTLLGSPAARLGAYGLVLLAALGGGAALGAAIGPSPAAGGSEVDGDDGFHLDLQTATVDAGAPSTLRLVIEDSDGAPVTAYDVAHEKELHLVLVGRDLRTYAHLHPSRDAAGTWTVTAPAVPAGPYRVFADFVPADGERTTLAADLGVSGSYAPRLVPEPARETSVAGYDVAFDGPLVAGEESELTITVTRDGAPVDDLDPYLGALGHLVAIRDGDMAYLHVHPLDGADGPGGPTVRFALDVPSAGTYGLFFDFSHRGDVHTAAVVTTVGAASDEPAKGSHGDGQHE